MSSVSIPAAAGRAGRRLAAGLIALSLLCAGVVLGRWSRPSGVAVSTPSEAVTVPAPERPARTRQPLGYRRTPQGAAAAAGHYVAALGGAAILDPARMRRTLTEVAARTALP